MSDTNTGTRAKIRVKEVIQLSMGEGAAQVMAGVV
jgi:hypothetical protein